MIIYEVSLMVQPEVVEEFETWLKKHVKEMLAIEGFDRGQYYQNLDDSTAPSIEFVCHYHVSSTNHLQNYFETHAPRMRGEGLEKFPNQFTARRRILALQEDLESGE